MVWISKIYHFAVHSQSGSNLRLWYMGICAAIPIFPCVKTVIEVIRGSYEKSFCHAYYSNSEIKAVH